jgi:hypothetical protein
MEKYGRRSQYRVIDLTDDSGFNCGKFLGDLGVDVIKKEDSGVTPAGT